MKVAKTKNGSWYVTDGHHVYPCTALRLNQAAKSQSIGLEVISHRTPRRVLLKRGNGKMLQTDRYWKLHEGLFEAAEIIFTLQKLDNKGKRRFYKKLGL